jgi:DNA-binding NarL/FixJ family response regulator
MCMLHQCDGAVRTVTSCWLTAAAELRERLPGCRVLILTGLAGPDSRNRALAAGVSGFLVKDGPADDLVDAVRRAVGGE